MAKKKEEQLTYGQMPLPQGQGSYTRLKVNWSGLNRRQTVDTGVLSMESNISTAEAPYLTPSQLPQELEKNYEKAEGATQYPKVISMFGFDGFLIVIYRQVNNEYHRVNGVLVRDKDELKIDYIELDKSGAVTATHTGYITQKDNDGNVSRRALEPLKTGETDEQRSMVQFNVYENAADVLDGVYVKKLLLFPDKVSMFMKIITVSDNSEMTDTDVMYCNSKEKEYYTVSYDDGGDRVLTKSGDTGYFMTDALDVVVKEYYNDGYALSTEKTYNDGYAPASHKWFNYDGYMPMSKDPQSRTKFNDGFIAAKKSTYSAANKMAYYTRSGSYPPYTYTRAVLDEDDSLKGLYEPCDFTISMPATLGAFYRRITPKPDSGYPYEYEQVALEYEDDISDLFMYVGNSSYPYTKATLYEREESKPTEVTEDISVGTDYADLNVERTYSVKTVTYTEKTGLAYHDPITNLYEKTTDTDIEVPTYYKRGSMKDGEYQYEIVDGLTYGKDVSKFYTYTGNYAPPEGSSHNCYWKNTATQMCYCYDNENKEWAVALPPAFPNLKYAAVHLSRLFGVDEDRVHVSGFNDYANWNLDTVTESNESNAWSSAAQANTKANGEFTGITVYDNHVVCFKRDFMHEIYNNKNPFRLVDVYAEGSIDNRSIQEVDGKLIFVSDDEVKVYTGGNPRIIGYYLGIDKFTAAVSGSDGRNYYLYCEDGSNKYLFVYDTFVEQWSQRAIGSDSAVLNFAHNKNGMCMLTDKGIIYKLDTGLYNHDWSFETDMSTSLTASSSSSYPTVSVKHISKLQMLAYVDTDTDNEAWFKVYALYDNEEYNDTEEWANKNKSRLLYDSKNNRGTFPVRLKPRMTANYGFKLHFEGHGYVRLYEMELRTTAGGELYR